ncbi:hypothetical protein H5410_062008 [Solanum commersonii]|uniref:Uncharacterized protein n=1 Tax=Solanum commersonii TaxID=4109 RepID=A0A9J5W9K7_SOLCO|nr:hypothetical protein H5410_062008 [Solanum commersonii]
MQLLETRNYLLLDEPLETSKKFGAKQSQTDPCDCVTKSKTSTDFIKSKRTLKADTVDYAQQDNNNPNDANSKDVDQQTTKINADQEHYGDVEENVLSDQEVSESLPTVITNQKGIQLYVELNEVLPITYEDKKTYNLTRKPLDKVAVTTDPASTDQRTNIHDEEQHGKREENINTDFSVSKSVCAEDRNQGGKLIDELKEDMITAQCEEQELQLEKNSVMELTKSKLNSEEENAQAYSYEVFDNNDLCSTRVFLKGLCSC